MTFGTTLVLGQKQKANLEILGVSCKTQISYFPIAQRTSLTSLYLFCSLSIDVITTHNTYRRWQVNEYEYGAPMKLPLTGQTRINRRETRPSAVLCC